MFDPDLPGAGRLSRSQPPGEQLSVGSAGIEAEPDSFVLYRIIGNDLPPRHVKGQSLANLRFLLEREPPLAGCEKRWVVNRIVDAVEEAAVVALLEQHRQDFLHIPFAAEEYRRIGWDFAALPEGLLVSLPFQDLEPRAREEAQVAFGRSKNNYITNNNGARNAALADGRGRAKWVLPWDGNCLLTEAAWAEIVAAVADSPSARYIVVPMQRMLDNEACFQEDFRPAPGEEPQLIFRRDAGEGFDPSHPWGRRSKVELLWRLGVPGVWDRWKHDPWDFPLPSLSPEAGQFATAGWVARLFSGVEELERGGSPSMIARGASRREAIVAAFFETNRRIAGRPADPCGLAFYSTAALDAARQAFRTGEGGLGSVAAEIVADAERTLALGPYSVIQKSAGRPSGDPHDYCSPSPYWWPDPKQPDGRPYVRRDGLRIPAAELFSAESGQYDRTRLQLLFDGTTALALGWYLTGRPEFAHRGALLVRTWFVEPATRMNPHLEFAQVRLGHNGDRGVYNGIIEFKDIYYLLDAACLLERSGVLTADDRAGLSAWLGEYLGWLLGSDFGKRERSALNNHGTYFDLQAVAIQSYLGDRRGLGESFLRAMARMRQHFEPDGSQPGELERTTSRHYVHFNLQGWLHLLLLLRNSGLYDIDYSQEPYRRLAAAVAGVRRDAGLPWPHAQIDGFDEDRIHPLLALAASLGLGDRAVVEVGGAMQRARLDPFSGVAPYWQLALC